MNNPTDARERIWAEADDEDAWHCLCGNEPCEDGFYPCDQNGDEMEPTMESDWSGLYVCFREGCGRIIDQQSLEVVGRNLAPKLLD